MNVNGNRKCVEVIFFEVKGNCEIPEFEISSVDCPCFSMKLHAVSPYFNLPAELQIRGGTNDYN